MQAVLLQADVVVTVNGVIFSSSSFSSFLLPYFSPRRVWGTILKFCMGIISGTTPTPSKKPILGGQKGKWAAVGARNIRYDFLMVEGDALFIT